MAYLSPEIFATTDPLRLAGSRCLNCGHVQFPPGEHCPGCAGGEGRRFALPEHGVVWTWTVQRFAPKAPYVVADDGFAPFAVGYVDLGCVLVESVLLGPLDELSIGASVHLVSHDLGGSDDVQSYAFSA